MSDDTTAFAVGDKATLNSGSPVLTVTELLGNGSVEVAWFDLNDQPTTAVFPVACLTPHA